MNGSDAKARLTRILLKFSEMTGGAPSLKEFLQLLEWSSDGIYSAPLAFEAVLADGTVYTGPESSRIPELGDSIFTDVADILAGSFQRESEGEGPIPPSELAEILLDLLNDKSASLADVRRGSVSRLSIVVAKEGTPPAVGDILAIPGKNAWYAMIVVARNRFGVAYGIFKQVFDSLTSVNPQSSTADQVPVYSDDAQVLNGSWKVVGHDESLLSAFPAEPEIYHSPTPGWPDRDFGEFGAAESPGGRLRRLDFSEATAVGIVGGHYRQSYSSEFLEQTLSTLVNR